MKKACIRQAFVYFRISISSTWKVSSFPASRWFASSSTESSPTEVTVTLMGLPPRVIMEDTQDIFPGRHGDAEGNPPLRIVVGVGAEGLVLSLADAMETAAAQGPAVGAGKGTPCPLLAPGRRRFILLPGGGTEKKRPGFPGKKLRQETGRNGDDLFPGKAGNSQIRHPPQQPYIRFAFPRHVSRPFRPPALNAS